MVKYVIQYSMREAVNSRRDCVINRGVGVFRLYREGGLMFSFGTALTLLLLQIKFQNKVSAYYST